MKHPFYNTDNFPNYVVTDSNWSIWSDGAGHCAAIPTPKMAKQGCRASHFGDMNHVRYTLGVKTY